MSVYVHTAARKLRLVAVPHVAKVKSSLSVHWRVCKYSDVFYSLTKHLQPTSKQGC